MRVYSVQGIRSRALRLGLAVVLAACCAVALAAGTRAPDKSDVVQVRLGGDSAQARLVVDLRKGAAGEVDPSSSGPERISLLLRDASASGVLHGVGRGLVRGWTVMDAPGGAKLTIQLAYPGAVKRRFLLPPADGIADYRYVIDLAGLGPPPTRLAPAVAAAVEAQPTRAVHARKVIVIDPGHGGKDPGAAGDHTFEKYVTLGEALAVKARLEATGRYDVVMTRSTDVYVPLEERVAIARRVGADLFLSLHADSGPDPSIHGASVYTLSERGQQRVGYVLGRHEWFLQDAVASDDGAVGQILLDLTQRTTRNRSANFAQTLIERVGDRAPLLPRSQRDAEYFVLLAPDVPAALLEMGFITNPADEARLQNPGQRAALADKIAQSIDAYFAAGTRLVQR